MAPASRSPSREFLVRSCAILLHGDAVLAEESNDEEAGRFYCLPGGHLEFGERLGACLSRELYEEAGLHVEVDKLVYVHENFFRHFGVDTHEIGFYFLVDVASEFPSPDGEGYVPHRASRLRMRLLPLQDLARERLLPAFLRERLPTDASQAFAHPTRHLVTREG
ncbi:MAG: NUDIX hydrolase [Methanobacteriota archaeon]